MHGVSCYRRSGRKGVELHHIFGGAARYDEPANFMTLCPGHHDYATDNERDARCICSGIKVLKGEFDAERANAASGKDVAGWVAVQLENGVLSEDGERFARLVIKQV